MTIEDGKRPNAWVGFGYLFAFVFPPMGLIVGGALSTSPDTREHGLAVSPSFIAVVFVL